MRHRDPADLERSIDELFSLSDDLLPADAETIFGELRQRLASGGLRAAEPGSHGWLVHAWVQRGILLGFRLGRIEDFSTDSRAKFFDKNTLPLRHFEIVDGVRIAPGGSSIRDGAYVAGGVVCMPPTYINIGAHVGQQTLIDSHVLVGACAQVGEHVHLGCGSLLANALDPRGELPVIVEDGAYLAGPCSVRGGVLLKKEVVLAPGVCLSRGMAVYDLVNGVVHRAEKGSFLAIPRGAVVVPGSRPAGGRLARREELERYVPLVAHYRDPGEDGERALERAL